MSVWSRAGEGQSGQARDCPSRLLKLGLQRGDNSKDVFDMIDQLLLNDRQDWRCSARRCLWRSKQSPSQPCLGHAPGARRSQPLVDIRTHAPHPRSPTRQSPPIHSTHLEMSMSARPRPGVRPSAGPAPRRVPAISRPASTSNHSSKSTTPSLTGPRSTESLSGSSKGKDAEGNINVVVRCR